MWGHKLRVRRRKILYIRVSLLLKQRTFDSADGTERKQNEELMV